MIELVSFKNFKALREVSLPLERFTVLVGPNASGKTSVLQGLDHLFFLRHDDVDYFSRERHFRVLQSHGMGDGDSIVLSGSGTWSQQPGSIELSLFLRSSCATNTTRCGR